MNEFWLRADSEDAALRGDEARRLGLFGQLVEVGVLKRGEDLDEIECDACGDGHIESVVWIREPAGTQPRAYIWCPDAGRVTVDLERIEVWRIDCEKIASVVGEVMGLVSQPRTIVEERVWLLGTEVFGGRTRDVFLVRGPAWQDGVQLLVETARLKDSPCPLILVPARYPRDAAWTARSRVVMPISEFEWFGHQPHEARRMIEERLNEFDRPTEVVIDRTIRREGQYWTLAFAGKTIRMRHSKGLLYLSYALSSPGTEFSVARLVTVAQGQTVTPVSGSAGEVLDTQAISEYKARAKAISDEIDEARRNNDRGRVEQLQEELEWMLKEMSAAKGLGGRNRKVGDTNERARKAVREAITRSIREIRKSHASLAKHLAEHIHRGAFVSYSGDQASWNL